jgi:hypothetical protein
MKSSTLPRFQMGPGFWAYTPQEDRSSHLRRYTARAKELLADCQECLPDDDRLQLIVEAAMEARGLHYLAALLEPSTTELDTYFDHFVLSAVFGSRISFGVPHEN